MTQFITVKGHGLIKNAFLLNWWEFWTSFWSCINFISQHAQINYFKKFLLSHIHWRYQSSGVLGVPILFNLLRQVVGYCCYDVCACSKVMHVQAWNCLCIHDKISDLVLKCMPGKRKIAQFLRFIILKIEMRCGTDKWWIVAWHVSCNVWFTH